MKDIDTSFIDKAAVFAVNAHKNVARRGKDTPYVLHCFEAAAIVSTITSDKEIIAASLLHDVIEDTDYTVEDIKKEFGERVARLVSSETDDREKFKTWKEIKANSLLHLKNSSKDVKTVALGDKLSNMRAIARDYAVQGDKLWSLFHESDPKLHAWRYNELLKCFEEFADTLAYKEFNYLVNKIFNNK